MICSPIRFVRRLSFVTLMCGLLPGVSPVTRGQGNFIEPTTVLCTMSQPGGVFGWSTDKLGDIDNDGITDFVIPAPFRNEVFVYSGATCEVIYHFTSPIGGGFFGNDVGDAGDVDGDNVHDIIVGASDENVGADPGRAFVYSGATGLLIQTLTGESAGDRFGFDVSTAGDVNQDGRDDVIVGAIFNDTMGSNSGRAYIYSVMENTIIRTLEAERFGDNFGSGAASMGDITGDGIPDQVVSAMNAGPNRDGEAYLFSGADGSRVFEMSSAAGGAKFGQRFIDAAGDVTRNGTTDIYVADWNFSGGRGKAYVFSGVDGSLVHEWTGNVPSDGLGPGRGAGDIDGDGHADLSIGYWTANDGGPGAGKVVIYSGKTGLAMRTITSLTPGENFGFNATGVGDNNGDGMIDFLCGAASGNRVYLIAGDIEQSTEGDSDGDGDADLIDFANLLDCVSGPLDLMGQECEVFDSDEDGDVDFGDAGWFQRIFTGDCGVVITEQPADVAACEGGIAIFQVQAAGPSLSYQWRRDGFAIEGATDPVFAIAPVTPEDTGVYTVTVSSECAIRNSVSVELTIADAPLILSDPESTSTCLGGSVQFTVEATGVDPLTYQWQFDGVDIPGATEPSLVIKSVGPEELGAYRCVVTDDCELSTTSNPAELTFFANAEIVDQPVGGTFCIGDQVIVFVIDSGGVAYQWFKDDVPIDGETSFFLIINDATPDDAGAYHVEVFGECNSVVSDDAVVDVIDCGSP